MDVASEVAGHGYASQGGAPRAVLQCPLCPKTFYRRDSLSVHMCSHTGQAPYECPFCALRFTDKSNLRRHKKRKHSNLYVPSKRGLQTNMQHNAHADPQLNSQPNNAFE